MKPQTSIVFLLTTVCALLLIGTAAPRAAAQGDSALDSAVAAAIARFNDRPGSLTFYREAGRITDADDAVIFVEVVNRATGEAYPGVIDWLYAKLTGTDWTVTIPGDSNYSAAYRLISDSLKDQIDAADRLYRTQADPSLVSPQRLLDYELPFPDGATGTVTRSFNVHGTGKIDLDLTGHDISATKDGVIVYANDLSGTHAYQAGGWWYWNTVIIRHADHQYSLYGHLAQGSIPEWIKAQCSPDVSASNCSVPIRVGEVIAQEGNTGYSTNPHVHVEFGQGFGVVPYTDVLDGDNDGDQSEVVYAGYVYGEQNVGLNGYPPDQVAAWQYLTVLRSDIP